MAGAAPRKSCLKRKAPGASPAKRVRFAAGAALCKVVGGDPDAAAAPAPAPPKKGGFQFATFTTVSTRAAAPLMPTVPTGGARKKGRWADEAWPAAARANRGATAVPDGAYELVWEWFCDVCDASIPDDETRYACAVTLDYCQCGACYRAGIASARRYAHPLTPVAGPAATPETSRPGVAAGA